MVKNASATFAKRNRKLITISCLFLVSLDVIIFVFMWFRFVQNIEMLLAGMLGIVKVVISIFYMAQTLKFLGHSVRLLSSSSSMQILGKIRRMAKILLVGAIAMFVNVLAMFIVAVSGISMSGVWEPQGHLIVLGLLFVPSRYVVSLCAILLFQQSSTNAGRKTSVVKNGAASTLPSQATVGSAANASQATSYIANSQTSAMEFESTAASTNKTKFSETSKD